MGYYKAPKHRRRPRYRAQSHARLFDGSMRYFDKPFTRRDPGKPYSLELLAFYREQELKD